MSSANLSTVSAILSRLLKYSASSSIILDNLVKSGYSYIFSFNKNCFIKRWTIKSGYLLIGDVKWV